MKYFFDTEFLEGTQLKRVPFINLSYGKTKNTIDLISIGIVAEDGREYYAISKDFNLKEAWERWQIDADNKKKADRLGLIPIKTYWIRDNVLKPIFEDLLDINASKIWDSIDEVKSLELEFTYNNLKELLDKYGKTNQQIAKEIQKFTMGYPHPDGVGIQLDDNIEFYAYYADYDWVVFCWLFGTMMNLPKSFPKYCKDLKQIIDEKIEKRYKAAYKDGFKDFKLPPIKEWVNYPQQTNEHNALADAKWDYEFYKFLNTI